MRTSLRLLGCALLVASVALAVGGVGRGGGGAHAAGSSVALQPPGQVVQIGENVTVDVAVSGVTDLAAWQVVIRYDPAVLSFVSVQPTTWLASTGRQPSCPAVIVGPAPPLGVTGLVQFSCGTLAPEPPAGVSGDGVVARVTFTAVAAGTSNLELMQAQLALPEGSDCCGAPATFEGAVKVVQQGSNDTAPPPTPTPNPAKMTPTAIPGLNNPDELRLPAGARTTPSAGEQPPSGTVNNGGAGSGAPGRGDVAGGLFGGSSSGGSAGGRAGPTGAPRAGAGTLRTERSLAVRVGAGVLAAAGVASLAVAAFERRRRAAKAE